MGPHAPEGSPGGVAGPPPGWWLGPQPVLVLSSPDAPASLPTWRPEGVRAFLSWVLWQNCQKREGGQSGVQSRRCLPQPLKCVRLQFMAPSPQCKSLPSLSGLFMTRAGVAGQRGQGSPSCGWADRTSPPAAGGCARGHGVPAGHFSKAASALKEVSSFLAAIKAVSPHQAMCTQGWVCPEKALFLHTQRGAGWPPEALRLCLGVTRHQADFGWGGGPEGAQQVGLCTHTGILLPSAQQPFPNS